MIHKSWSVSRVLIIGCVVAPAWGVEQVARLNPNPASGSFGYSVAVSGDYIAVGAPFDQELDPGNQHGAAYIFKREGANWVQEAKIFPSQLGFASSFGYSVAVDGSRLVAGAPNVPPAGAGFGSAYVFRRDETGWTEEVRLTTGGPPLQANQFGISVAIEGDVMVAGATALARAYVYRRNGTTWVEEAVLTGADTVPEDAFGWSVSLFGSRIVVGAHLANSPGENAGAVYMFTWTGTKWTQETKLTSADAGAGDLFGFAVSLAGDQALIGAHGHNRGAAYVFFHDGDNWIEQAKLTALDTISADGFGWSVALDGAMAMVGAPFDDDVGAVYVFQCEGGRWEQVQKLLPNAGDILGRSVSIDRNYAASQSYVYAVPFIAPCIPTLRAWGLVVLALGIVVVGTLRLRRRSVLATCLALLVAANGAAQELTGCRRRSENSVPL